MVINRAMAEKYFPGENPIGRRIGVFGGTEARHEIVGVVGDARYDTLRGGTRPTAYVPFTMDNTGMINRHWGEMNFSVRTRGNPDALVAAVQRVMRETGANLPMTDVPSMKEQVDRLFAQERLFARLSSLFGALALTLVCIGLYGLMSYAVVRRTGEIGIRMALGALPRRVLWMILRESLGLASMGVVIGVVGASIATRLIAQMLYGPVADGSNHL